MSDPSYLYANGRDPSERWEAQLVATAHAFPYPPTPDLAAAVRRGLNKTARPAWARGRRGGRGPARAGLSPSLAWGLALLLVLLAGLLAVPQVRAGLLELIRIGVVEIRLAPPTATVAVPTPTGTRRPPTATPLPSPTPIRSILELAGETTLEDARTKAGFPIRLPTYPAGLGEPDRVFLQDLDGTAVVLVWLNPNRPDEVLLSLHTLTSRTIAEKGLHVEKDTGRLEFTSVNGREAAWTTGPYMMQVRNGVFAFTRLIEGHVLIWTEGELTYRLETGLALHEAVRIAESLEP